MLVLTRKSGETIKIGEDIQLIVTQISRNRIRIGIEAPTSVRVRRGDLVMHTDAGTPHAGATLAK